MSEQIPLKSVVITIDGMHCQNCVAKVQEALAATPGVRQAQVDLQRGQAHVTFDGAAVSIARLMEAVTKAGFGAVGFTRGLPPA